MTIWQNMDVSHSSYCSHGCYYITAPSSLSVVVTQSWVPWTLVVTHKVHEATFYDRNLTINVPHTLGVSLSYRLWNKHIQLCPCKCIIIGKSGWLQFQAEMKKFSRLLSIIFYLHNLTTVFFQYIFHFKD